MKSGKKPMSHLNDIFQAELEKIPHRFLAKLLKRKLAAQGFDLSDDDARAFAAHIFNSPDEPFEWDDGNEGKHQSISVSLTEAEMQGLELEISDFTENKLPDLMYSVSRDSAKRIGKSLRKNWPNQKEYDGAVVADFLDNLEGDWGEAFDILCMMLTISREIGPEFSAWAASGEAPKAPARYEALLKLHARGCQVVDEIICLMENGFADGAFARWRTLHEITVVAALIADGDEELAIRYFDHEAIEAKRAMDHFKVHYDELGYEKPDDDEIANIERTYEEFLERYGHGFGAEFGWAAPHLGKKRVRFIDLEEAAGQVAARSFYKFASHNVHASSKGVNYRLGLIDQDEVLLAGRSNVGFFEPAHNTAKALCQLNGTILRDRWDLDTLVTYQILLNLWDEVPDACHDTQEAIEARDEAFKKSQMMQYPKE